MVEKSQEASSLKLWEKILIFLPSWHKAFVMNNCKQNNLKYHWREKMSSIYISLEIVMELMAKASYETCCYPILLWKEHG
jgi:hypothetical protein